MIPFLDLARVTAQHRDEIDPAVAEVVGSGRYVLGDQVTLVSSADECARDVFGTLTDHGLLHDEPREAQRTFLTTGNPDRFSGIAHRLLGNFVSNTAQVYAATA